MNIRLLQPLEAPPYKLLLLADPSRSIVEKYVKRGRCFLLEEKSRIIGAYILLPVNPETIELVNIAVEETCQGTGIGRQLMEHAIKQAKAGGYQTMEVGTGNSSISQIAFYQKCGFRMISIDRDFFLRHYKEEIWENGIQCRDMIRMAMTLT
ncbi:GNAT family N-acetyltransferase [Domibacillus sp.]|uniref:GNAT family N-acetyltransferase n=1 Tax=Domibacillus sp. TaxID=1969783 RepID=UPI0028120748|nr:GNAT family N-acetyltransferase [Domibacillus sp.]